MDWFDDILLFALILMMIINVDNSKIGPRGILWKRVMVFKYKTVVHSFLFKSYGIISLWYLQRGARRTPKE